MAEWGGERNNENNITDIRKFFDEPGKPIPLAEFKEFWLSLSEEEKDEFHKARLEA